MLRPGVHQEKLLKFRALPDTREDFPPARKQTERHQEAQAGKSQEFDQGLKHHHRHQPFVAFRGVQMAGPKQDAEHGQEQGHIKGGVLINRDGQGRGNFFMKPGC